MYGIDNQAKPVTVKPFRMDSRPVSNSNFFDFLSTHEEWRADQVSHSFADSNYLAHWKQPEIQKNDRPVVRVSWFAAAAYCEARGGRLPLTNEWEFVAIADGSILDARKSASYRGRILKWYSQPGDSAKLTSVNDGIPNIYGIYHLHGLIWEWTEDFNTFFAMMDSRGDSEKSKEQFCGAGAGNANDREDYPAFMRYAMRSSLTAQSTQPLLGFRCAYD